MNYLVVYDICNPKRLRRVERMMKCYGFRVQKSVFECDLSDNSVKNLKKNAHNIIDPVCDSIRLYPLPGQAREKQLILGQGDLAPLQACLVI